MAVVKYSTRLPDGRTLEIIPDVGGATFKIDADIVSRQQAEAAWNEQPEEWQRGRTMEQALNIWQGR